MYRMLSLLWMPLPYGGCSYGAGSGKADIILLLCHVDLWTDTFEPVIFARWSVFIYTFSGLCLIPVTSASSICIKAEHAVVTWKKGLKAEILGFQILL